MTVATLLARAGIGRGWRRFGPNRGITLGASLVGIIVVAALLADWLAPLDPVRNNFRARLHAPDGAWLLGTDRFGRDILSRILFGARVSLRIAVVVAIVSGLAGGLVGLAAGWWRWLDAPLMRLMDGLMAFPGVLLAIALAAVLGPSEGNAIIALTVAYSPRTARVMRGAVLVARAQDYVEAARATGMGTVRLVWRHVLPACAPTMVVQQTYVFALAVLAEAVLSFVGVGAAPTGRNAGQHHCRWA